MTVVAIGVAMAGIPKRKAKLNVGIRRDQGFF